MQKKNKFKKDQFWRTRANDLVRILKIYEDGSMSAEFVKTKRKYLYSERGRWSLYAEMDDLIKQETNSKIILKEYFEVATQ